MQRSAQPCRLAASHRRQPARTSILADSTWALAAAQRCCSGRYPGWARRDAVCMALLFHGKLALFLLFICQQDLRRLGFQI